MSRKYTFEEIQQIVSETSSCEILSTPDEFSGVTKKLRFRCACGNEFMTDMHHFVGQNQKQCPDCGRAKQHESLLIPLPNLISRIRELGCEYVSGPYTGRKSCITIRCVCGHERTIRPNSIFHPSFSGLCSSCSVSIQHDRTRMRIDEIEVLLASRGVTLLSSEYRNSRTPLRLLCSCGNEFTSTYDAIKQGYKRPCCHVCAGRVSSGELAVEHWLTKNGFRFEKEKTFPGCGASDRPYRFDFFLPDANLCIEYDGQQHFKIVDYSGRGDFEKLNRILWDTQTHDLAKDVYCSEHGINLLRIRYDEADKIPDILSNTLIPR